MKKLSFSIASLLDERRVEVEKEAEKSLGLLELSLLGDGLTQLECQLEALDLWKEFSKLGTEMIITKSGRRMFPDLKVNFANVQPNALYYIFIDAVLVDNSKYRYIYNKSAWVSTGNAEPASPPNCLFLHPDSPFTSEQMVKQVVSFEKVKLTNNQAHLKTGHLVLNSMQKYQPRVYVVRREMDRPIEVASRSFDLRNEQAKSFVFKETQFIAVTAYQNQLEFESCAFSLQLYTFQQSLYETVFFAAFLGRFAIAASIARTLV